MKKVQRMVFARKVVIVYKETGVRVFIREV